MMIPVEVGISLIATDLSDGYLQCCLMIRPKRVIF